MSKEASIWKTHNFDSKWKLFSSITLNNVCSCLGQNRSSVQSFYWVQQKHWLCVCVRQVCVWVCVVVWIEVETNWSSAAARSSSCRQVGGKNLIFNTKCSFNCENDSRGRGVTNGFGSTWKLWYFTFCWSETGPSLGRWFWLVFVELCMSVWLVREGTGPCLDPEQNWLYKAVSVVWTWSCFVRAECSAFSVLSQSRIKFLISD